MKKLLSILSLAFITFSCNTISDNPNVTEEAADDEVSELKNEVMAVHDTAMAKMGEATRLMKELQDEWQNSVDSMPYRQAYRELLQAKDGMMEWMRSYKEPEDAEVEEIKTFLLEEKKAIEAVNTQLDQAINEARHLLETTTDYEADNVEASSSEMDQDPPH